MTTLFNWLSIPVAKAADLGLSLTEAKDLNGGGNTAVGVFLNRIAELLLIVAVPLAIIGVLYAAYSLIIARGNPSGYQEAKTKLLTVFGGLFLLAGAALMVRYFYNLLHF